jgi:hypothetical protein
MTHYAFWNFSHLIVSSQINNQRPTGDLVTLEPSSSPSNRGFLDWLATEIIEVMYVLQLLSFDYPF